MTATVTATFTSPIPYGDGKLEKLIMRRPMAGDLRGINLSGISTLEPSMFIKIAARTAMQHVTEAQLEMLEAYDLMALINAVTDFFVPPGRPAESPMTSTEHGDT